MIIEMVKICNFGPFHGEHEIKFSVNGSNGLGVHLMRGNTGQGKTSIQRAILWCLYGNVIDRKGKDIQPTSLINHTARDDDIYQFYVRIFFTHKGIRGSISRTMTATKHADNRYREGMDLDVTLDGVTQPNPQQVIERMIPYDVNKYFFFDGEMLRDYEDLLDESSPRASILRDAIEHILGVPYFRIARDDIRALKKRMDSERTRLLKRLGGKQYEELAQDLQSINEEIELKEKSIEELGVQLEKFKLDVSDKMRDMADLRDVKELVEKRLKLVGELNQLNRQRDSITSDMQTFASKLYKIILSDRAQKMLRELELKHETSTKKYAEKQQLIGRVKDIKSIIEVKKCRYCDTDITPEKIKELNKQIRDLEISINDLTQIPEPNHEFEDSKSILEKMLSQKMDAKESSTLQTQLSKVNHAIATKNEELAQIAAKLGDPKQEEAVRILERTIQEMLKEQGKMEERLEGLKSSLIEDFDIRNELDKQLASISREEINELTERIKTLGLIESVFEEAISEYRTNKRLEVERNATEIFRILRSKANYDRLEINNQYGLSIITKNNRVLNRSEWRSSGEEQLVALSLIGALNKCAQIKAPVLMDTPFGRLDIKHGARVLGYIPELSDQVVLLVTDREFRKGDEKYLNGTIRTDNEVTYNEELECSKISPTRAEEG